MAHNSNNLRGGYKLAAQSQNGQLVISGMSGKFPNSNSVQEFMEKIYKKENLCDDDLRRQIFSHPEIPKVYGKVHNLENLDNGFFGLHSFHGIYTCPMSRMMLEQVVSALLDAGIHPDELIGTRTGVFIGSCSSEYESVKFKIKHRNSNILPGTTRSMIAQRVSYFLKLNGPAIIADTACSSSMYALDCAYRSILEGHCDRAIVGGTNIVLDGFWTLQFARLGVLNLGSGCRPFDNAATGYTRSEAIVAIILQRQREAKRVYAHLVHVKSSVDGYKPQGITFPSSHGQIDVLNEACKEANVQPTQFGYVEAHGTGTVVGDPEELFVLDSFFKPTVEQPLLIGSVKGNIGHTEASSGLCSIVKVATSLNNGKLAPNIHYETPREGITSLIDERLKVVTEITNFPDDKELAGVNCFGFGGANVHAILRRYKRNKANVPNGFNGNMTQTRLICYSGRNKKAIHQLQDHVQSTDDVDFLALLQESFKVPLENHLFRGFSILGTTITSYKPVEYRTRKKLIVIFGQYSKGYNFDNILEIPLLRRIYKEFKSNNNTLNSEIMMYTIMMKAFAVLSLRPKVCNESLSSKMEKCFANGLMTNDILTLFNSPNFKKYQTRQASSIDKNCTILVLGDELKLPSNYKVLNFSNCMTSSSFLENIGRLYEDGFNPQISKLYDPIQYPVKRGTQMISHLIGWRSSIFKTPRFGKIRYPGIEKKEWLKCNESPDVAFYRGHLIDNRNLFPATGYLWHIWELYADCNGTHPDLFSVTFENVRFHRACTITAKALDLYLVIHPSGYFEVSENNILIVSGWIFELGSFENVICEPIEETFHMNSKDIYKELRIRGYNYKGYFRSLHEVNSSSATIRWENWVTFLDSMMQMSILQMDTRSLFVPIGIDKISIRAKEHLQSVEKSSENLVAIQFSKNSKTIRSANVEMRGLHAKSILKRKEFLKPVLESYEFVPNEMETDLPTSIRINMQLLLECKPIVNWPILEVLDLNDKFVLSQDICNILEDLPLIIPSMSILTETEDFQMENATVVKTISDRYLLFVCKNPDDNMWIESQKTLIDDGFLLCFCSQSFEFQPSSNFIVLTKHSLSKTQEVIYFCRKKMKFDSEPEIVDVSTLEPKWLTQLQNKLGTGKNIALLAENLQESGIIGLTNCLRKEPDGEKVQCAFVQDSTIDSNVLMLQLEKQMPMNIYQQGQWGTYRHLLLPKLQSVESYHWFAGVLKPGDLSSTSCLQGPLKENNHKQCERIKVVYAALNFRDLMLASRKISPEEITYDRRYLDKLTGFEFSGIDSSGKRVVGMSNGAISNYLENPLFLLEVPKGWEMDDAATALVVYGTILIAFSKVGNLRKGQSILIHSGAGAVGLCTLNICTYYQLNIFVTVGTEEKRTYLLQHYPNLKSSNIGNSRDTSFKEMIKRETGGRGVDIIINSLAEEKLHASVECLAIGGHFLEIGKYDMTKNSEMSLELTKRHCSFHGVMLDHMLLSESECHRQKLKFLMHEALESGYMKPLPKNIFNINELEKAFKFMSTGKHIGKILIRIDHDRINRNVLPYFNCDQHCSYIIFGGLGGFGLELADWLVVRGAQNLILSSRNGVTTGYQKYRISIWKSYGVNIIISSDDTTTYEKCSRFLQKIQAIAPIDGIFNLAVVLHDAVFNNQTMNSMQTSMLPKATLTSHLDKVTRELCPKMSHFVVFSSVSCGRGNAGQTNYGYSNSIMERICERRYRDGFRALAIQWGAVGDVGLLEELQKEKNEIAIGGTLQQKIGNCLMVLDGLLMRENVPIISSMVVAEKFAKLTADSPLEAVKTILAISDIKSVSPHATLPELGMDSMMSVEIRQTLERDFDIVLGPKDMRTLTFTAIENFNRADRRVNENAVSDNESLKMIIPKIFSYKTSMQSSIIDYNIEASKKVGDFILVFLGIEADFSRYEKISEKIQRHVKCVNVDAITKEYERTDIIVDHVFQSISHEILVSNCIHICSHSMGCIPAIETARRFGNIGVRTNIVFIDSSPKLIGNMFDMLSAGSEENFHYNVLHELINSALPAIDTSDLKATLAKGKDFNEKLDISLKHFIPTDNELVEDMRSMASRIMSKLLSVQKYKPINCKKLESNVILYKPSIKSFHNLSDDHDLHTIFEEVKKIEIFDGNHQTILDNDLMLQQLSLDLSL